MFFLRLWVSTLKNIYTSSPFMIGMSWSIRITSNEVAPDRWRSTACCPFSTSWISFVNLLKRALWILLMRQSSSTISTEKLLLDSMISTLLELEASFPDIIFPRFRTLWAIKLLISQTLYSLKLKPSYLYFQVLPSSWDC